MTGNWRRVSEPCGNLAMSQTASKHALVFSVYARACVCSLFRFKGSVCVWGYQVGAGANRCYWIYERRILSLFSLEIPALMSLWGMSSRPVALIWMYLHPKPIFTFFAPCPAPGLIGQCSEVNFVRALWCCLWDMNHCWWLMGILRSSLPLSPVLELCYSC